MKLSDIAKKMILIVCISVSVIIVIGVVCFRSLSCLPFVLGVLLGGLLNALKIIMLDRVVDKSVKMEEKKASNYAWFQSLLRFVLTGAVLAIAAIFLDYWGIWGAVAGILTMTVATFFVRKG